MSVDSTFVVLRHPSMKVEAKSLQDECEKLGRITVYKRRPLQEDAPKYTDCLTAMGYLLERISKITNENGFRFGWLERIGNMAGKMVENWGWGVLKISPSKLQPGDLVFLTEKGKYRLSTHVAMGIGGQNVFHSSRHNSGGRVENLEAVFTRYNPFLKVSVLIDYVDPRPAIPAPSMSESDSEAPLCHSLSSSPPDSVLEAQFNAKKRIASLPPPELSNLQTRSGSNSIATVTTSAPSSDSEILTPQANHSDSDSEVAALTSGKRLSLPSPPIRIPLTPRILKQRFLDRVVPPVVARIRTSIVH